MEALKIRSSSISDALRDELEARTQLNNDDPFIIADVGEVIERLTEWRKRLPMVQPFYSLKCNSDPEIVKILCKEGIGFDCASKGEIQCVLNHGVSPSRIIFANVVKATTHLQFAKKQKVALMTFDNLAELHKISRYYSDAEVVIRILIEGTRSKYSLGGKAGAPLSTVDTLLQKAKDLGVNVVGVSFHVGCMCFDPVSYERALMQAREVFDIGKTYGYQFKLLDIGGGFPGDLKYDGSFADMADTIRICLKKLFPSNIRVIAEPGRYLVASAYVLATSVIGRRMNAPESVRSSVKWMYYLNEGLYGCFSMITSGSIVVRPKILSHNRKFYYTRDSELNDQLQHEPRFTSILWGPTCDTADCLFNNILLPELQVDDWIVFDSMGAYTTGTSTEFNGFPKTEILYINSSADC
ncbi:ornithine decarboxylase [Basidiobolus meristosporus CBS 931.73]|uniref:Ornithine decarboxylase n=1 Tax=Basidiobolus meristosporus CBS 931.73 TaxID=1314790 RepID=A0A1Y1X411_9FUNG|nr:ornithine decarboxylase [Basidiobolus meristosporus CBS 931.73]|eukprot:ORX80054.1 ornithine decarboxylase [Basidiobolus meristosporus CBS 931.73]